MQFTIPAEHEKAAGVYAIRNSLDSRVYVGSAKNLWRRFTRHRYNLNRGSHHSRKLQNFAAKYGVGVLEFALLELCEPIKEQYLACEQKWLNQLRAAQDGFNISPMATSRLGVKGKPLAENQKEAIKKAHKGKQVSQGTRDKLSKAKRGQRLSQETIRYRRRERVMFQQPKREPKCRLLVLVKSSTFQKSSGQLQVKE